MEKYTEEQKKQYNEYWSYFYGTDYHDYYRDCMAQGAEGSTDTSKAGSESQEGAQTQEGEQNAKKKTKKRRQQQQKRDEGIVFRDHF